jgi:trehalose 6-phosphate synthase
LIVVSHRGPYRFFLSDDGTFTAHRGAGGLVSALGPLLLDTPEPHTWIAAALSPHDVAAAAAGETDDLGVDLRLLALDPHEHRLHYDVISNGVLWFLTHDLFDAIRRPTFDRRFREAWDAYVSVNEAFARAAEEAAPEHDIVLVHDYQLALVPLMLRERRPDLRVTHFTHTPFPGPDGIRVLPIDVAKQLCGSLASVAAGFHTPRWASNYLASAREVVGDDAIAHLPYASSLGTDVAALEEIAREPDTRDAANALDEVVGDRLVVLRTDRVDPSKNIVRGFAAFDRLLEMRPGLRGRVVFVALVYPSREALPEYLAYANEIEQIVDRVNDRWATSDWLPIVLDQRDDFARSVAGMQRYDVLFVNPIKDGLNLVAKEGPILNRRDGLVCLSREAGAFADMRGVVLELHPFDLDQMAGALDRALAEPLDVRAERAARTRSVAAARTPAMWLSELVAHAT